MGPEELNDILIHAVPNAWARQSYLKGWDFEGIAYKDTCFMFERMETAQAIYEGEHLLKILIGHNPTVPVLTGSKREGEPPRHPTLRRAALVSAR